MGATEVGLLEASLEGLGPGVPGVLSGSHFLAPALRMEVYNDQLSRPYGRVVGCWSAVLREVWPAM